MSKNITAQIVLDRVNQYINDLEFERTTWNPRPSLKIDDVYRELSIFDWWKDTLSVSNLKDMKKFLEEAIKLGFDGYVCFKVGVSGCSNGMWASTELSTDGCSPDGGATLYKSFTPDCNYWSFTLDNNDWLPAGKDYDSLTTIQKLEEAFNREKIASAKKRAESILETTSAPYLEIEISESEHSLDEIIEAVRTVYGEQWKFWGTAKRFESCLMAVFEMQQ